MLTKLDIISETVKYYSEDVSRRAVKESGSCSYYTEDDRVCGVARCLGDPKSVEERATICHSTDISSLTKASIISDLSFKEEYRGHSVEFWMYIQRLHDSCGFNYWDSNGLTEEGEEYVKQLKEKYSN